VRRAALLSEFERALKNAAWWLKSPPCCISWKTGDAGARMIFGSVPICRTAGDKVRACAMAQCRGAGHRSVGVLVFSKVAEVNPPVLAGDQGSLRKTRCARG